MYTIIIGCGRIGGTLAMELSNEGHHVVIIDHDQSKLDLLGSGFNGIRLRGIEYDYDVLSSAGIGSADFFLAMTAEDNINIMAAQVARQIFNVKNIIARVCDPRKQFLYDQLEINSICPTTQGVNQVKGLIEDEKHISLLSLDADTELIKFMLTSKTVKTVADLNNKFHLAICHLVRDHQSVFPLSNTQLEINDILVCAVKKSDKKKIIRKLSES